MLPAEERSSGAGDEARDDEIDVGDFSGPLEWYWHFSQRNDFQVDSEQLQGARASSQRLFEELEDYRQYRAGKLNRLVTNLGAGRKPPRGMYIWGGVGRGKSLMMDAFFKVSRHRRKRRVHFHEFMREIHARMRALSGTEDPLEAIATEIARDLRLLAFDEFHVSDIADAMILGAPARAPDREGRRARADVQLQARRSLSQRAAARALPPGHRGPQARPRRGRAFRRHRPSPPAAGRARRSTTRRSTRTPTRTSRSSSRR